MNDKNQQTGNSNQVQNPPYESVGRSIADDIVIERLINAIEAVECPNLVKDLLNTLNENSNSLFNIYLKEKMLPNQVIQHNHNDNIEDCENRLEFLFQNYQSSS